LIPSESPPEDLSPVEPSHIETFELEESSSESVTPDMDAQVLFIKLKEVRLLTISVPSEAEFNSYPRVDQTPSEHNIFQGYRPK
jgi:hypothetical protein